MREWRPLRHTEPLLCLAMDAALGAAPNPIYRRTDVTPFAMVDIATLHDVRIDAKCYYVVARESDGGSPWGSAPWSASAMDSLWLLMVATVGNSRRFMMSTRTKALVVVSATVHDEVHVGHDARGHGAKWSK